MNKRNIVSAITTILIGVAVSTVFATPRALAARAEMFDQVDVSKNVSQLIRSNSNHFWNFARLRSRESALAPYTRFEGVIAGDPHLGNFGVIPVRSVSGTESLRYVNIDFDDAGAGPFALDFARLSIAIKAIDEDIKLKVLIESYRSGLRGEAKEVPVDLEQALRVSMSEYTKLYDKYVDKKTSGGRFKMKAGELEPVRDATLASKLRPFLSDMSLEDLAVRPKERGGSAGGLRLWALAKDKAGRLRIVEFKKWQESGLSRYRTQPPVDQWLQLVRNAFWPGFDGSTYDLANIPDIGPFWIREKKVTVFEPDYDLDEKAGREAMEKLASYAAYTLGAIHGRQKSAAPYRDLIEQEPDAFREAIKPIVHDYLAIANETMSKR